MSNPREPLNGNPGLGKKIEPKRPTPSTDDNSWQPYKPGIEINSKGQLHTVGLPPKG